MTEERWLPVVGYEDLYEVSDLGRVRSLDRWVTERGSTKRPYLVRGRLRSLKPQADSGYILVPLSREGADRNYRVHTLVLEAFVRPKPPNLECLHADGDRANNALSNLSWGTRQQNMHDAMRHGTHVSVGRAQSRCCKRGHVLAPPNLMPSGLARGARNCLACDHGRGDFRAARRKGVTLDLQVASDRRYAKIMDRVA